MGLKVIEIGGQNCLTMVCDHCGKPIHVDADQWGGVFAYRRDDTGSFDPVLLHRPDCFAAYRRAHPEFTDAMGWNHLDGGLCNLLFNWLHPFGKSVSDANVEEWNRNWQALTGIAYRDLSG